ncbi:MAG TPA: hypothetical protein VF796_03020 [Humisphaera sp.]
MRTRFRRILSCTCAIALIVVGIGCSMVEYRYRPGLAPRVVACEREGQYHLYEEGNVVPLRVVYLKQGERVGFERDAGGQLIAVNGTNTLALADGDFRWQLYTGRPENDESTLTTVSRTALVGLASLCAPFRR